MIDIHTHVLVGVDDGPETLEKALSMLRLAQASGTTDLVATPHADQKYKHDFAAASSALQSLAAAAGAAAPRLHLGCELQVTYENVVACLGSPGSYSIAQGPYVLVEMPVGTVPYALGGILERFCEAGVRPIVAHPERSLFIQTQPDIVIPWLRGGCSLQVTASAVLGRFGRKAEAAARTLLERGLVHLLASDAHDDVHRSPVMTDSFEWISQQGGDRLAEALFVGNPRAVLEGRELPEPLPLEKKPLRRWFQLRV